MFKAEVPGPVKDKLSPRVTETAKVLWAVYFLLTIGEVLLLLAENLRTTIPCSPEIAQPINQNRLEPAAKSARLPTMMEFAEILRHGQQDLLREVVDGRRVAHESS